MTFTRSSAMEPSSLRVPSLSGRLALLFPSSPVRMKLYSQYIHPRLFCQADSSESVLESREIAFEPFDCNCLDEMAAVCLESIEIALDWSRWIRRRSGAGFVGKINRTLILAPRRRKKPLGAFDKPSRETLRIPARISAIEGIQDRWPHPVRHYRRLRMAFHATAQKRSR